MSTTDTVTVAVRISTQERDRLERAARRGHRTISGELRLALEKHLFPYDGPDEDEGDLVVHTLESLRSKWAAGDSKRSQGESDARI